MQDDIFTDSPVAVMEPQTQRNQKPKKVKVPACQACGEPFEPGWRQCTNDLCWVCAPGENL